MGNITDKIKELPDLMADIRSAYEEWMNGEYRDRLEWGRLMNSRGVWPKDYLALVASHERMRQALKQIIKWEETLEVESAVLKIAREALKGVEKCQHTKDS